LGLPDKARGAGDGPIWVPGMLLFIVPAGIIGAGAVSPTIPAFGPVLHAPMVCYLWSRWFCECQTLVGLQSGWAVLFCNLVRWAYGDA